jgi:hypothetical protein
MPNHFRHRHSALSCHYKQMRLATILIRLRLDFCHDAMLFGLNFHATSGRLDDLRYGHILEPQEETT